MSDKLRTITLVAVLISLSPFCSEATEAASNLSRMVCDRRSEIVADARDNKPQAQATLSKLYHGGYCGLPRDDTQAVRWATSSAEQGNSSAQALLALLLTQGSGVEKNYGEAIKWARLSANQNDVPGIDYLALMLHEGWGSEKNDKESLKWASRTAAIGDAQGEALVALLLSNGKAVTRDDVQAAKWARMAADQGHGGAQELLASFYQFGRGGLPRDLIEADKWSLLAERSEHSLYVRLARKALEASMSAHDIAEAAKKADAWRP